MPWMAFMIDIRRFFREAFNSRGQVGFFPSQEGSEGFAPSTAGLYHPRVVFPPDDQLPVTRLSHLDMRDRVLISVSSRRMCLDLQRNSEGREYRGRPPAIARSYSPLVRSPTTDPHFDRADRA